MSKRIGWLLSIMLLSVLAIVAAYWTKHSSVLPRNEPRRSHTDWAIMNEFFAVEEQRPVVLLAISGGGARAAALGYFVLRSLKNITYAEKGSRRRLIDDVRLVSAVSGGSVIAAHFALYGPDRLTDFYRDFLHKNNNRNILLYSLRPDRLARLAFTGYSRSDLFADWLNYRLFKGARYSDIMTPGRRPLLMLNATDMSAGEILSFTYHFFDDICSDLARFPLAHAVASSAAFPVFLSPVPLTNHMNPGCRSDLDDWGLEWEGIRLEYRRAQKYSADLRGARGATRDVRYVHLIDGGLSDNVGVRRLIYELTQGHLRGNLGKFKKLIVIVVNARVGGRPELDVGGSTPSMWSVLNAVSSVPMGNSSANSVEELEKVVQDIYEEDRARRPGLTRAEFINVDLKEIESFCAVEFSRRLNSVPTSWTISSEDLTYLEAAADDLVPAGFFGLEDSKNLEIEAKTAGAGFCQRNQRPAPELAAKRPG